VTGSTSIGTAGRPTSCCSAPPSSERPCLSPPPSLPLHSSPHSPARVSSDGIARQVDDLSRHARRSRRRRTRPHRQITNVGLGASVTRRNPTIGVVPAVAEPQFWCPPWCHLSQIWRHGAKLARTENPVRPAQTGRTRTRESPRGRSTDQKVGGSTGSATFTASAGVPSTTRESWAVRTTARNRSIARRVCIVRTDENRSKACWA
jgi:hypothetical protein